MKLRQSRRTRRTKWKRIKWKMKNRKAKIQAAGPAPDGSRSGTRALESLAFPFALAVALPSIATNWLDSSINEAGRIHHSAFVIQHFSVSLPSSAGDHRLPGFGLPQRAGRGYAAGLV